jgi:hypothetical protein
MGFKPAGHPADAQPPSFAERQFSVVNDAELPLG